MPTDNMSTLDQAPAANEYDEMLKSQAETRQRSQAQSVQQAVYAGSSMNPEQAARIEKLSQQVGLGDDTIQRNQDRIERDLIVASNDYDALVKKSPRFASWMAQKRTNAAMVRDDMDAMGSLEQKVQEHGLLADGYHAVMSGLTKLGENVANIPGTLVDIANVANANRLKDLGEEPIPTQSSRQLGLQVSHNLSDSYQSLMTPNQGALDAFGKGEIAKGARSLFLQFVQGAPTMAAAIFAGPVGGPAVFGATMASESNVQGQEAGLSTENAVAGALGTGAVGATVQNAFGFSKVLQSWEHSMVGLYGKPLTQQVMREFSKTLAYSVGGEGIAQGAQAGANDVINYMTGLNPHALDHVLGDVAEGGLMGAATGAGFSAMGLGSSRLLQRAHDTRMANLSKDFYLSFGKDAAALKLRERLPEAQRAFIEHAVDGTGTENVFIPVDAMQTLFQSKKILPEVAAQELGILKQYNEAVETGQDMQIPLALWAQKAAHTDTWAELADDIKFDPSKPSLKEAREEHANTARQVIEEAKRAREADDAHQASVKYVQSDVAKQLQSIGYSQKEANINAQLHAAFFDSVAQRTGLSPSDIYRDTGLVISNPEMQAQAEQMAVAQAAAPSIQDRESVAQKIIDDAIAEGPSPDGRHPKSQDLRNALDEGDIVRVVRHGKETVYTVENKNGRFELNDANGSGSGLEADSGLPFLDRISRPTTEGGVEEKPFVIVEKKSPRVDPTRTTLNQDAKPPAPAFYSKLIQTVEQKMGGRAKPDEIRAMLRDMKPEEMKFSGINDFLDGKEIVTKSDLLDHLRENQVQLNEITKSQKQVEPTADHYTVHFKWAEDGAPGRLQQKYRTREEAQAALDKTQKYRGADNKDWEIREQMSRPEVIDDTQYSKYQLPGGENYREMLFQLPGKLGDLNKQFMDWAADKYGDRFLDFDDKKLNEIGKQFKHERMIQADRESYTSSHFEEKNVLAHTRLNDRVDADGKRVLFVEEIQSDWHQEGRKKGYQGDAPKQRNFSEYMNEKYPGIPAEEVSAQFKAGDSEDFADWRAEQDNALKGTSAVPDAPLKKTWHEFVLKRLIREAAEKGYDKIAWTTGEQQADRYDLAKQVDEVQAFKNDDGTFDVEAWKGGDMIQEGSSLTHTQLESQLGKDLAAKIIAEEGTEVPLKGGLAYSGKDLKVGGEGMKGFYDKILVDAANKLGKKSGAKVEETTLAAAEPRNQNEEDQALLADLHDKNQTKVHSLEITPKLRDEALNQGFSFYQSGEEGPRAQIRFGKDRQFNIDLFKSRDTSSFAHESAHFFLEVMGDLASKENVSEGLKNDYAAILKELGVNSREEIGTEHHEQFARGFERYLMEGKAPSSKLRKVFNTFKTWLTSIYRSAKALDVEISPEMKAVFDRMLVSDEQVSRAEETMNYRPIFDNPEINEAMAKARASADDTIRTKLMDDVRKLDHADYKRVESEQRESIRSELADTREYKALDVLQGRADADTLPLLTGVTDLKISRDSIQEMFGDDALKEMPRNTTSKDGVHAEIAAQLLGYADGKQMIEALRNLPKLKDAVEARVSDKMQELFPDYLLNPNISDDAVKAVHNDSRQKVLRLELEHILKNEPGLGKEIARKAIGRMPREEAVKEQAAKQIGSLNVKDIRPSVFQRAEVKASREAAAAYNKGDWQALFDAKNRELLNNELYRSATDAQAQIDKQVKFIQKIFKKDADLAKSRDIDFVNAARAVVAAHGLAPADKPPLSYLKGMEEYNPTGFAAMVPLINSAIENQTGPAEGSYKAMKLDDFVAMTDAVSAMWDMAKTSREQTIDGKKVATDKIVEELIAPLADQPSRIRDRGKHQLTTKWQQIEIGLMGVASKLRRVEHWARVMDNDLINGIFTRAIFRPISEKQTQFILAEAKTRDFLAEAIKDVKNDKKNIAAPELGGFMFDDINQLRHAMLHTGNDSNLSKLLLGRGWGFKNEDGSLDRSQWDSFMDRMHREGTITKADWDFAQKIWDHSETLKPEAQKAHKEVTGFHFNEITKRSFETPFGEYDGGYVPAKTDTWEVVGAQQNQDATTLAQNSFMLPTTGKGWAKSRVDQYTKPLALNLNLLPSHFSDVLRFTHLEPTVVEVRRLLSNRTFKEQMNLVDPTVIPEMLEPWLDRSAKQQIVTPSTGKGGHLMDAAAKWLRSSASMQIMTVNIPAAAENLLGAQVAMARLGVKNVISGYWELFRNPGGTHEMIMDKSDFMKTRIGENAQKSREAYSDFVLDPNLYQKVRDAAKKGGMILEHASNHITESTVWLAAYRKAIGENLPEIDAVRTADNVVRTSTADMTPSGVSKLESGTPFERLFTMFSGYFINQGNNGISEMQLAKKMGLTTGAGSKRALMGYAMMVMGPAITSGLIKRAFKGQNLFDANEDGRYFDDFVDLFLLGQAQYMLAAVPGGSTLNALLNQVNDNPFDDKINISPAASIIETAFNTPGEIKRYAKTGQGEGKALRDGLTALGLISGLPTGLAAKPLGYLADIQEGKARPTGPIDYTRGLVTGKPGGRAKY